MENKRRDKKHGRPDPDAAVDTTELADKVSVYFDSVATVYIDNVCGMYRLLCSDMSLSFFVLDFS